LVGLYAATSMPTTPAARWIGVISVVVTYAAVRKIAQRVAMETLKD
jgi:hypothetical protein